MIGLQAALEQERQARLAASAETLAAEAASRSVLAEREARSRDLQAARAALHEASDKLATAVAERDMHYARVSALCISCVLVLRHSVPNVPPFFFLIFMSLMTFNGFHFTISGNKTKTGYEFCHATQNVLKIGRYVRDGVS